MRTNRLSLAVLLVLGFLSGDCKKDDPGPIAPGGSTVSGALTTGSSVDVGSMAIGPGGGSFVISKPGTPIDGMRIDVPANAYSDMRTYQVSYAPIQGNQLGQYFNPASPLITISNGGDYSDSVMRVKIPVKIAPSEIAMAFSYDPVKGELEGLPMIGWDSTSLTIVTRHFASSALSGSTGLLRLTKQTDVGRVAEFVVSKILRSVLNYNSSSGFLPHVHDWQFINDGSIITPKGNCGGQSTTAIWYYLTKKSQGSPNLWGRFDNDGNTPPTPNVWEDDVLGYKFCSIVQADVVWASFPGFVAWLFQGGIPTDVSTFDLFTYSLLVTHKPALVLLSGAGDEGHAIVCYATTTNSLLVADPNFPGTMGRAIDFDGTYFKPYESAQKAGAVGEMYPTVRYGGNSSIINFDKIDQRWKEVASRTIGNDKFPTFSVQIINDSDKVVPLEEGYTQRKRSVSIKIDAPAFNPGYILYEENQNKLDPSRSELSSGKHKLGVAVYDDNSNWVGFKWTNISIMADTSIIPLTIGNTWTYREVNYQVDASPIDSSEVTVSVTKDTTINGEKWYQVSETQGQRSVPGWLTRRADGIYLLSPLGGSNPAILAEKFPAQAGESFKSGLDGSITVQVVSTNSSKVVRAGTFERCYEYVRLPPPGGRPRTSHAFFALGVGQIATTDYEPDGNGGQYVVTDRQLVSYTLK